MNSGHGVEADGDQEQRVADFGGEIEDAVLSLRAARLGWRKAQAKGLHVASFPSPTQLALAVGHLSHALYPVRLGEYRGAPEGEDRFVAEALEAAFAILRAEIASEFAYWQGYAAEAFDADQPDLIVRLFSTTLGRIRETLDQDMEAAFVGDPAARTVDEILISYPGAIAILHHRIAHQLQKLGVPIVARMISELANARTGIDIHPGATIGPSFFIDHGAGVVIGETAIVGRNVRLYQHVTLGASSPLGLARVGPRQRHARHPIVEDDVVIYAGATILGRITIGRGSIIGGNVWLLEDVPPGSTLVQPKAETLENRARAEFTAQLKGRA
ncbi:serine O-acetyltransferase [Sandaracinobacter sp. RS1-74]|uniref:serine O-acetyltransferase EpsC n=1 Tax=Sandaracinobacteroides sayramensis TaxID=2913411 RepID=UPI001EDB5C71|nr:serine O-acetyltransferase EpsC [Sandaracinobacteroides sayramensis]MCG2842094.1 serine O-acetyltransferase [Sandaracinobacteroides sayramensis]